MQVQARVAGGEADGDSDKEWVTTRDQVLKGLEHVRNFMDANPESMAHFEGGWGGASVCLIGMRRGVEGCLEPMGQRQATLAGSGVPMGQNDVRGGCSARAPRSPSVGAGRRVPLGQSDKHGSCQKRVSQGPPVGAGPGVPIRRSDVRRGCRGFWVFGFLGFRAGSSTGGASDNS